MILRCFVSIYVGHACFSFLVDYQISIELVYQENLGGQEQKQHKYGYAKKGLAKEKKALGRKRENY